MKLKASVFALAAMFMALALTGCYTQVVKKEPVETRPEYSESATEDERDYQDEDRDYRDYDHVTNVYVYDDSYYRRYYWDRWDPWYAWRYRYPHSGWYVRIGYHDYDYWDWSCGTRWSGYYDPWWDRYAYAGWGPRWGWYDPYWGNSSYVPRDRAHVNEKRPFGRRSSSNDEGSGGAVARRGSDRSHLSKPEGTTYARGEDGIYRRTRRTDTEAIRDTRTEGSGSASDGRRTARRGASDSRTDETVSLPSTGSTSVARPARTRETPTEAKSPSSTSERRTSKREKSENDKVSRRSSSDDSGSSSRGTSGSSTSTSRRSSNSGNSGGSSSGVSRSGNSSSGSSSKGSSSSGNSSSSSNNNSSSGSNRRSRN